MVFWIVWLYTASNNVPISTKTSLITRRISPKTSITAGECQFRLHSALKEKLSIKGRYKQKMITAMSKGERSAVKIMMSLSSG